jgi:DNA-binding GntR family transcriptional regulator
MSLIEKPRLIVHRETLVDRLVHLLQESILSGDLKPKTKLSEAQVAKEFGVSRAPAREALQRLEEMNLIRKNHLGREVAEFSPDEFQQIYELKNVVEAFGAMQGALKAKEEEMTKIQSVLRRMEQCVASGDLTHLRYLNYEFHDLLVSCCENKKLIETYQSLVKQIRWATSLSLELPARPEESFREHREVFEAFQRQDAESVRVLLEAHSHANMNRILSQMEVKGETPRAVPHQE